VKRSSALDLRLALALGFLVALNLPYFDPHVVPIHDTFYNFANFHVFYGELFSHGDLASWYPYGTYGLPSDFEQAASLSAFDYLAGALGALLRVRDALWLFKLATLGELVALVAGVYLLARRLFPSPDTALALGIAAAGSAVWTVQQWWDLRLYYLLPLVLYFAVRFQEGRRPEHLWLAGATGVAWALGTTPYAVPLQALVVASVVAVALGRELPRRAAALAAPTRRGLLALGLFAAAACAYLWFVPHALDHVGLHAPDRDPVTGQVSLKTFRSYGGNANLVIVANALLFGWPLQFQWGSAFDNSFYLGLVPLVGLALALARERSRTFLALLVAAVALVLLSFGGLFTTLVYYLPGMAWYRHVALVYGLVKVLLLLASGYGIERLWALGPPRFSSPALWVVGGAFLLEAAVALPRLFDPLGPGHWTSSWGAHVLVRLCVYGALLAASRFTPLPWRAATVLGLALDLAVFQFVFYRYWDPQLRVRDERQLLAAQVRAPEYQPERREEPPGELGALATALATARVPRPLWKAYWYVYPFAQFDPCKSAFRTDYLPLGVDRLLALERQGLLLGPTLGCRAPKLRVVANASVADSAEAAERTFAAALRAGRAAPVVVQALAGAPPPPPAPAAAAAEAGRVRVTGFQLGRLRAEVEVDAAEGAWLVYADAYHPAWRAAVDGRETAVYPANLAFKAVRVPRGTSRVELWFDHGANGVLRYGLAGFGAAFAAALLGGVALTLARGGAPRGP
jgi:hypothetical protein